MVLLVTRKIQVVCLLGALNFKVQPFWALCLYSSEILIEWFYFSIFFSYLDFCFSYVSTVFHLQFIFNGTTIKMTCIFKLAYKLFGAVFLLAIIFCGLKLVNAAEKLLVLLRDGRKLLGILRSFDQFGMNFATLIV